MDDQLARAQFWGLIARAVGVIVLLLLASIAVRRRIADTHGGILPDEGVTIRNAMEVIVKASADSRRPRWAPSGRSGSRSSARCSSSS